MRLSIKARLIIAFTTVLTLSVVLTYIGINSLKLLNDTEDGVINGPATGTRLALLIDVELSQLEILEKNAIIEANPEKLKQIVLNIKEQHHRVKNSLKEWQTIAGVDERKKIDHFVSIVNELEHSQEETLRLAMLHSVATATLLSFGKGNELFETTMKMASDLEHTVNSSNSPTVQTKSRSLPSWGV